MEMKMRRRWWGPDLAAGFGNKALSVCVCVSASSKSKWEWRLVFGNNRIIGNEFIWCLYSTFYTHLWNI